MKKKEIDIFAVLIGIVIGVLFGYFIGMRMNTHEVPQEVINDKPSFGNVYLLQILSGDDLNDINDVLKSLDDNISYEIVRSHNTYFVYAFISCDQTVIEEKKEDYVAMGFNNALIKSEYLLDWANKYIEDQEKYDFYHQAITNLIKSINDDPIEINDQYYTYPVDLQVFTNLIMLQNLKNSQIREDLQLNTYKILYDRLK